MATDSILTLNEILQKDEGTLLQNWVDSQVNALAGRNAGWKGDGARCIEPIAACEYQRIG